VSDKARLKDPDCRRGGAHLFFHLLTGSFIMPTSAGGIFFLPAARWGQRTANESPAGLSIQSEEKCRKMLPQVKEHLLRELKRCDDLVATRLRFHATMRDDNARYQYWSAMISPWERIAIEICWQLKD
jgi:hypothetical protein